MAATITFPEPGMPVALVQGRVRRAFVKFAFDAAYPAAGTFAQNGYSYTPAQFGMAVVFMINILGTSQAGRVIHWDQANSHIHVWDTYKTEVANNTDIHTDYVFLEVIGE